MKLHKVTTLCCMGIQDVNPMIEHSVEKFEGDPVEETSNYTFIFRGLNDSKIKFEKFGVQHKLCK